jgi:hypothetical protein
MTYSEMLAQIEDLETWLRAAGVEPRSTRLSKYKGDISILADPKKLQNLLTHFNESELRELFFTFTEVNELHTIYSVLSPHHESLLKGRFSEVVTGPPSSAAEKPSNSGNRPRNIQFELLLAALFVKAGFPVVDDPNSDVQTGFEHRRIIVECKRPQRLTGIRAAIKDGVNQLRKRLESGDTDAVGVLALSLTKVLTEGDTLIRAPDTRIALKVLSRTIQQHIQPREPYFQAQARSSVAGILVHASAPTIPQNPPSIATVSMQLFFNNPVAMDDDQKFVERWFHEYDRLEKLPM